MEQLINQELLPLYAITSVKSGKHYAMIAAWVAPASLRTNEIRFTLTLSKDNHSTATIMTAKQFLIQPLPESAFKMAFKFGLYHSERFDKFKNEEFMAHESGLRILKIAKAYGLAKIISHLENEDRIILNCAVDKMIKNSQDQTTLNKQNLFSQITESERTLLQQKFKNDSERETKLAK